MKKIFKHRRIAAWSLVFMLAFPGISSAAVVEKTKISGGVDYQHNSEVINSNSQAIRILTADLSDPYTKVDVGIPNPLDSLLATTKRANSFSVDGNQVVGAVNGSFFGQDRLPMYLISYRNKLVNAGIIASGFDQYVNKPIAFGIDSTGKAKIDTYNLNLTFEHNGVTNEITSTNKQRTDNNLILYTPIFPSETTETNEMGMEIVISGATPGTDLTFGQTITGRVVAKKEHGSPNSSVIPRDGFVLSAHGDAMQLIKHIQVNDTISINVDIDDQWLNSQFMLTSGPLLVKNGQVDLQIDPKSSRATERAPRTAIAIDQTGSKVFMVTVDGRQEGYSKGMNLVEFANYLKSIGAYSALNLDGGGSTTMGVRKPGEFNVSLFNRPSDGRERSVSTILYALSNAPKGTAQTIGARLSKNGVYLKGTKGNVVVDYVMDQYYNPVAYNPANVKVSSNLATVSGLNFTANKAGKGSINVAYGTATKSIPFEVVEKITKIEPSESSITVKTGQKKQLSVNAKDSQNRNVIFDPSLVTWSVSDNIGTISSSGLFTAGDKDGKGTITAKLANMTVSIPVTVSGSILSIDNMESLSNWSNSSVEGSSSIAMNNTKEPAFEGKGAVKLAYDFTNKSGTSAAYLTAKTPLSTEGSPVAIGMRVFGDAGETWLRGRIVDGNGNKHTIDFTPENGLKWIGWNFVTANVPAGLPAPIKLEEVYIAQPTASLKTKGTIMFDDLKAIFSTNYREPLFKDTGLTFRAEKEITDLVNRGVISGYGDGNFWPYQDLTRLQGAILLARALDLPLNNVKDPGFSDMKSTQNFYEEVAAVANAGIIRGKESGTKFDPSGKLTRAEMAAILQRGFELELTDKNYFSDTKGSFAYQQINSLAYNDITQGIGGGKYGPALNITRADFSVFLYRALNK